MDVVPAMADETLSGFLEDLEEEEAEVEEEQYKENPEPDDDEL